MTRRPVPVWPIALATMAFLLLPIPLSAQPAPAGTPLYPLGSRIGLVPPPGIAPSQVFPGFEDRTNNVFIRLVVMPGEAFAEIEKTMTQETLLKQGLAMERRESFALPGGKGILMTGRQEANAIKLHKWMLIAPLSDFTALVSFEIPDTAKDRYPEAAIRAALATTTARVVPAQEMLALLPFRLTELAGLRVAHVAPGAAVQLTDGTKDTYDTGQPQLVVSVAPGGPPDPRDRDKFARLALSGLPPMKDVRLTGSEPMRINGQPGHELRAEGKDPDNGADMQIVQWLRFGNGGYVHILGVGKKEGWTATFMRFRAVRDGVTSR